MEDREQGAVYNQLGWVFALCLQVAFSLLSWLTPAKKPEVQPPKPVRSGLLQTFEQVAEVTEVESEPQPPKPNTKPNTSTPPKAAQKSSSSPAPSTPRTKEKSPHKAKSPLTPRNSSNDGASTSAATSGSASKESSAAAVNAKDSPKFQMEEKPDMFSAMASMLISPKRST